MDSYCDNHDVALSNAQKSGTKTGEGPDYLAPAYGFRDYCAVGKAGQVAELNGAQL